MNTQIIVLSLVIGISVFVIIWNLLPEVKDNRLQQRLDKVVTPDLLDIDHVELAKPLSERVIYPLTSKVSHMLLTSTKTGQMQRLRILIQEAGSSRNPESVLWQQIICTSLGLVVGILLAFLLSLGGTLSILIVALGAGIGWYVPISNLRSQVRKRATDIRLSLPGAIDILAISMEAGLSFDMALSRLCQYEQNTLVEEFRTVLNEVRLGRSKSEALLAMEERSNVEELRVFIRAMVQAEPLGVGVVNVLRVQSEEMRRVRRQRAEELGHQAPVKMLLPMVGCIFPAIFIILLGPIAISLIHPHH